MSSSDLTNARSLLFQSLDAIKNADRSNGIIELPEFDDVVSKGVNFSNQVGLEYINNNETPIASLFSPNIGRLQRQEVIRHWAPGIRFKDFVFAEFKDGYFLNSPDTSFLTRDRDNQPEIITLDDTNMVFFGDQDPNGFAVARAFNHPDGDFPETFYWRSGRANSRAVRHYLGMFYPNAVNPSAYKIVGGTTDNTNIAFYSGILEGCTQPWNGGTHDDYEWETIDIVGDVETGASTGIVPLNLSKSYYGFRLSMEGARALSYFYARVRNFFLLS